MTRSARTPLEELRRSRQSMVPGTLDGRVAEARPIWTVSSEFITDDSIVEPAQVSGGTVVPNITKFFQDSFLGDGSPLQIVSLSYFPVENSEHIYVGGAYLSQKYWTRVGRVITIDNPNPYLGDPITVEYAYIVGQTPAMPDPEPLIFRDVSQAENGDTEVSLPTGTEVGDLILAAAWRTNGRGFTDERVRLVADLPAVFSGDVFTATYWIGYATSLEPLSVTPIPSDIAHTHAFYSCATFSPPVTLGESIFNTGPQGDNEVLVPSVYGHSSICYQLGNGSVTPAGLSLPPGYQFGATLGGNSLGEGRVDYWNGNGDEVIQSPDGIAVATGNLEGTWRSWVLAVNAYEV